MRWIIKRFVYADADRRNCPEAAGLYAVAHRFAVHGEEDRHKIELETPVYDARYAWCGTEVGPA